MQKNIHKWFPLWAMCPGFGLFLSFVVATNSFGDYSKETLAQQFRDEVIKEGISPVLVDRVLTNAQRKESILEAIARPAEKTKRWFEYRKIFLGEVRISGGVEFLIENKLIFEQAEKKFGVPREIIAAIIGVETRYGKYTGSHRVIDALATLAFDYPKRAPFFRSELSNLLFLVQEQNVDPLSLTGSYAGAMGLGQFMPSSYRNYAVDFDDDGKIDIWNNKADAIGSVANYLSAHGWERNEPIVSRGKWLDDAKVNQEKLRAMDYEFDEAFNQLRPPAMSKAELRSLNVGLGATRSGIIRSGIIRSDIINHNTVNDGFSKVAQPFYFYQENDLEIWLAYKNFYVITRYNHSHLYAMAVYQLSQEIDSAYKLSRRDQSFDIENSGNK